MPQDLAPVRRRSDAQDGAVIAGRFKVERVIARGGMSVVYQARQLAVDRKVALKILRPPADAEDPVATFVARFRQEAETLARLTHPNIVVLHDSGETEDGRFYLAMEFVDGPRLSDLVREGPLSPERAVQLMLQVCSALRYAHKRGVVHRDLKPSNLMIATDDAGGEQVKVLDFGLVKLMEQDQALTRENLILGSPHCMSPEQINAAEIDHRTDIYAIGVLLFRCVTGRYPFHGAQASATMVEHLHKPVPRFADVAPGAVFPEGLEEIVRRCLAKEPEDRYASMADLMEDLAVVLGVPESGYVTASQTHSTLGRTAMPAPSEGRGVALAAVVAGVALLIAVVAIVAIGFVFLRDSGDAAPPEVTSAPPVAAPPPEPVAVDPVEEPAGTAAPEEVAVQEPPAAPSRASSAAKAKVEPKKAAAPPAKEEPPPPAPPPAEEEVPDEPEGYMGVPDDLL